MIPARLLPMLYPSELGLAGAGSEDAEAIQGFCLHTGMVYLPGMKVGSVYIPGVKTGEKVC